MRAPQEEIFVEGPPCNTFLKYEVLPAGETAQVRAAVAPGLALAGQEGRHLVVGFGETVSRHAPATRRGIRVWLRGPRPGVNFDPAPGIDRALKGLAEPKVEISGFKYRGRSAT